MNNYSPYAIAAGHLITKQVAETILQSGGNAFDAAVACYLASFVSEPVMASACAGGFANIYTATGENFILDFFCQTPRSNSLKNPNYKEVIVDFGESTEMFYIGPASMAVPGAMGLVSYLAENLCTIPIRELIYPAQQLAKEGVFYTPFQAEDTELLSNILLDTERGRELFSNNEKILQVGDLFQLPMYADFLESYGRENSNWFYVGEVAQSIVSHTQENGGYLEYIDFTNYQVQKRKAFHFHSLGKKITTPGLPSMGGGLMSLFLKHLDICNFESLSNEHFASLHEAFNVALPFTKDPIKLFDKILEERNDNYKNDISNIIPGGTSHFNIKDHFGNAIALSTSIGEGSGYFIPGTDMQMNNMLGETALMPSGLGSWTPNARLASMMTPTMVFDDKNQLEVLTGSGGSTRIPFSIAQVLLNKYKLGLNIYDAIHLPRMYEGDEQIYLEKGFDFKQNLPDKVIKEWENLELLFGGVHLIDVKNQEAFGDDRREGNAVFAKEK